MKRRNALLPVLTVLIALGAQGVMAQDDKAKSNGAATATASADDLSPSKAYLELHKKVMQAKCYEDLTKLRSKNSVAQDPPMSDDDKKKMFPMFMMFQQKNIEITGEKSTGENTAEVYATADSELGKAKGVIKLEKEDAQWKLFKESWQSGPDTK